MIRENLLHLRSL